MQRSDIGPRLERNDGAHWGSTIEVPPEMLQNRARHGGANGGTRRTPCKRKGGDGSTRLRHPLACTPPSGEKTTCG